MEKFAGGAIAVICGSMLINGKKDLCEIKKAVNEIYRLNDALRIYISESEENVLQNVTEYTEQEINALCFEDKTELDAYAEDYAKKPLEFCGNLCEINIVTLPEQYGLLVKMHHIIGDAWTFSLLGTQFNKLMNGENVEAYSYTNYVESENAYIQSKRYERDKAFFLEQFKKCDEVTYLSEKQTDSLNACRKTFVVDKNKANLINDYAHQHGTSAFMMFTAALSVYMNRVKMNTEKFYIGTAVLNRNTAKEKNTAGMFVNTAPMLIELDNSKSFAENLSAIENTAFSIFRHQKYNYGDVLSAIRKEYNFTEKLYDVMISYQNATVIGADIETTWYHSGSQSESLQIHIDDRDNEGVFRIHYDYLTDKFTAEEIEKMHQHISNLLFDAISNDTKHIYEFKILSSNEKQKLLYDFNDTSVEYPRDKCVHQLFEKQVEKIPDKIAVIFQNKALTYFELNQLIQEYADKLVSIGIKEKDVIAIHLERSHKLIAFQLAVLKIGAIFLPVDKRYPIERVEYMCSDCNVKILISDEINAENISANIISLDEFEKINPDKSAVTVNNSDVCYIIYTSGSTGNPKGCMLTGNGLLNFCKNNNTLETLNKHSNNVFACVNSVSFDYFIAESLLPLTNGYTTVILDDNESTIQEQFLEVISKNNINVVMTTPTRLKIYFGENCNCQPLQQLTCICTSGEPLTPELLTQMYEKAPNAQIYNPIGPSECSVWDIGGKLNKNDGIDIHIGKPIANTQIYIVDKYMKPTPIGVTGELCIAGDGVGAGYLNRPELTAEKFIDNPFGEGKLYKTGDLAYWRDDGNIVYVGRNDFQVKIRGLRIELGEIENAICSIDGISQAVVVVRKNTEGRQLICAFYTGTERDAKEIRSHIGKKLPKYMLPHIFIHLDEMPLTSSGKINRKALPEVDLYAVDTTVEYVEPHTEKEKLLCEAIASILKIEKVGLADNFFDLGGDSLKAIELISKLEKRGYHTDTKTIFEYDTVKYLAEKITATEAGQEIFEYPAEIPANPAQMRVYTAQNMNADSTMYNVPYVFKAKSVDADRLQKAINALLDRHEILRTYFTNNNGTIVQIVDKKAECKVEILDSEDITDFIRPFNLGKAPLLRVGVYENTIMVDMHHIITDGGSMPVFFKELNELYMGRELDNTAVQYKEFAIQKQDHTESEKYWLSVYSDEVPVLEINTDFKRGQKQSFNGSAIYESLDIELHNKIVAFCKEHNITPFVFYMAGFNILLSKFSGNEDIVIGMPVSGRNSNYLDTIGMFVNTVALRNKPVGTKTITEFLHEVKENSVNAIKYQGYPYGELVKKLNINTKDRNPLFDVMFAYQSEQMTDIVFCDEKAELLPIPITTSKYDFTFNVMPRKNDIVVMVEYCTDLYKKSTIKRFVEGYKLILTQMLSD